MAPPEPQPASTPVSAGFPEPNYRQWQERVEQVLRKSGLLDEDAPAPDPVEDVLATTTYDDLTLHPLYTASPVESGYPGMPPYVRGSGPQGCVSGWDVRQQHRHPDPAETNREVLADLDNGVTSLWLRLGTGGLAVSELADALAGVHLEMIGVHLDAGPDCVPAADAFLQLARQRQVQAGTLRGNLGADPIGVQARTGKPAEFDWARELATRCAEQYPGLRAIAVDGLPYHDAGGSDAEELGCSLAAAVTYLRELEGTLGVDAACGLLEFRYAASADQFGTIAKFRAARRLWERVTRECGIAERLRAQQQHAVTSSAMLTRRDPWVNMVRTTIAAFGAGLGGAQAVTTQPFDAAIGLPDSFSRRVARNTQSLLLEESRLAHVIDPAGGAWYVETRTEELAAAAWRWFQEIEAAGGLVAALERGVIADRLASTRRRRERAIAHRDDPIIGVTEFPHLEEQPVHRPPAPEQPGGGLPRVRYAEPYERLRDASDELLAATGRRPTVFLATLGPVAAHTARASFARNLFAAGGLASVEAGPTESTEDIRTAFAGSGTTIACVCGSDSDYARRADATARALKESGADCVLLAGKPPERPLDSVDRYIHSGVDALAVLHELHNKFSRL